MSRIRGICQESKLSLQRQWFSLFLFFTSKRKKNNVRHQRIKISKNQVFDWVLEVCACIMHTDQARAGVTLYTQQNTHAIHATVAEPPKQTTDISLSPKACVHTTPLIYHLPEGMESHVPPR